MDEKQAPWVPQCPSAQLPWSGEGAVQELRNTMSGSISPFISDHSPQRFFSRPFSLEEMEGAKRHLSHRHTKGSPGLDRVSYQTVLDIPNEGLMTLFNACVDSLDAPQLWLTTVLVGILKIGRIATSPESYRLVGLECCRLAAVRFRTFRTMFEPEPNQMFGVRVQLNHRTRTWMEVRVRFSRTRTLGLEPNIFGTTSLAEAC
jgi:hypothetical protein